MYDINVINETELDLVTGSWSAGEIGGAILGAGAAYDLGIAGAELGAFGGPVGAMIGGALGVGFGMGIDYISHNGGGGRMWDAPAFARSQI